MKQSILILAAAATTLLIVGIPFQVFAAPISNLTSASVSNRAGAPLPTWVVTNSSPATAEITFSEFLKEVAEANLDYAAQLYNVDIAKAAVAIAKEFPNPNLSLSGSRDLRFHGVYKENENGQLVNQTQPEARTIGIDQPIEFFGKRKWRIKVSAGALHRPASRERKTVSQDERDFEREKQSAVNRVGTRSGACEHRSRSD